jgi:hypothetical protein
MKILRGGTRQGSPPPVARSAPAQSAESVRQTLLLQTLFEHVDEDRPLAVLDVGCGVTETIAFFSRYQCRLHFADLFDEPLLQQAPEGDPDEHYAEAFAHYADVFAEVCNFAPDTRFDICLLWDFPNYLPVPALRAFSNALVPYLGRRTRGHGFGAFKANAPAMESSAPESPLQFGIQDVDRVVVRPRRRGLTTNYAHSRAVLADAFGCFEIVRGTLLRDGAMELLLDARR